MALHQIPSEDLRVSCRQRLEACELWLRRLVHDKFIAEFGNDYIQNATVSGQAIFNTAIRKHVASRLSASPGHYARPIDTLQLDHLAKVICKHDSYKEFFRDAFQYEFPAGNDHLRLTIGRLLPIRNALAHANPLSLTDAERVLCYCSDIISSLSQHYAAIGMSEEFNAPSFTRFFDSTGNVKHLTETIGQLNFTKGTALRCGQQVRFEMEVDSHYPPDDYTVKWQVVNILHGESGHGTSFQLTLLPKHVNKSFCIFVSVKSKKDWHRHGDYDAKFNLVYKVLPPL